MKTKKPAVYFATLLLLILSACNLPFSPKSCSFTVQVKDQAGHPVENAIVQICNDDLCTKYATDEEGSISFLAMPGGVSATLLTLPDGYGLPEEKEFDFPKNGGTIIITIDNLLIGANNPDTKQDIAPSSLPQTLPEAGSEIKPESETKPEPDANESAYEYDPDALYLTFSTTDRNGNTVDESILADYDLTIINFFEPWCPPCCAEMPYLEEVYEEYRDKNVNMIGVYSDEDGVSDILKEAGTTYTVLKYTNDFDFFQTGYVPTTIFVDSHGKLLTHKLTDDDQYYIQNDGISKSIVEAVIIGGREKSDWESLTDSFLDEIK